MTRFTPLLAVMVASCSSATPALAKAVPSDGACSSIAIAGWLFLIPGASLLLIGVWRFYRRRHGDWRQARAAAAFERDMARREVRRQRRDRVRPPRDAGPEEDTCS